MKNLLLPLNSNFYYFTSKDSRLKSIHLKSQKMQLLQIASARSGDKNNKVNIGVMARKPEYYPLLKKYLTAERVKAHFGEMVQGKVERFEWEAIESLNFLCHEALAGGGARSIRMDTLGKNFSSHLLRMELEIEENIE